MKTIITCMFALISVITFGQLALADTYDAAADFSTKQGPIWYYKAFDGTKYYDMVYGGLDTAPDKWWVGIENCNTGGRFCLQGSGMFHPDKWDPVREFKVPAGVKEVSFYLFFERTEPQGDGIIIEILHNDKVIHGPAVLAPTETTSFNLTESVSGGDSIYFKVKQRENNGFDSTNFSATVVTH